MPQILYIYNTYNTFVEIDLKILQERYDVQPVYIRKRSLKLFPEMWRQSQSVDLVIAWFASWHSLPAFLVAAMRGIPRLLITGGYDVANVPEVNYGLRQGGIPYLMSDIVFRLTSIAVANSSTAYRETVQNTPLKASQVKTILHGVPKNSIFEIAEHKDNIALTVAVLKKLSVIRKGVVEFIKAAEYLPDMDFIVVGKPGDDYIDYLRQIAPPNVQFTGFLSDEDLAKLRQRAKVYVQASYHEGFGLALAESMLARAIPVVSRNGSIPEVVGDTGIYINEISPKAIADGVQRAMNLEEPLGELARQRVLTRFSVDTRADQLCQTIDDLLGKGED